MTDALQGLGDSSSEHDLLQAAARGWFIDARSFAQWLCGTARRSLPLSRFTQRDYSVRPATRDDLATLLELEKACWPAGIRATSKDIELRLANEPGGQLVLVADESVLGCVYSQRLRSEADLHRVSMRTVQRRHAADGPIVQLLALTVLPSHQDKQLGSQLLEVMLQRCALMTGVDTVVGITRCKDRAKHPQLSMDRYIELQDEDGRRVDSVLRFHELHGAQIVRAVAGYRPRDRLNEGYGVLVRYDIKRRRPLGCEDAGPAGRTSSSELARQFLEWVRNRLGLGAAQRLEMDRPLLELGLDSADLTDLAERLGAMRGSAISPVFFFEHNTSSKVVEALKPHATAAAPRSASSSQDQSAGERSRHAIAVIGMALRLPGGIGDAAGLWDLLENERTVVGALPQSRRGAHEAVQPRERYEGIDRGAFLDDITRFDARFFGVSPKEAQLMDPQQRLLLELSWNCLEDAGYSVRELGGSRTGVFVGASGSDYRVIADRNARRAEAYANLGTSMSLLANRISYFLDLHGPSMQIDTACSSSLVAVHQAMQSLRNGDCDLALVAGVNLICDAGTTLSYYRAGMLAKDGRCKTFDKAADGYVRGEGGIVLLLKPLGEAEKDADIIYAVLRGSATNHGGRTGGLTAPSPRRQAELVVAAFADAAVNGEDVTCIEAHGTGTALGDPVEVEGLKLAFERTSTAAGPSQPFCALGSIKTNLGHLEAAAGLAGVLKVVLSMQHRRIPATLNFAELNPKIALDGSPFFIARRMVPWQAGSRRRAGVSSFGSGGTNAHVVVEEHCVSSESAARADFCGDAVILLSARTPEAVARRAQLLLQVIDREQLKDGDIHRVAATLMTRDAMEHRAAMIVASVEQLRLGLSSLASGGELPDWVCRGTAQIKQGSESKMDATDGGAVPTLLQGWCSGDSVDWQRTYANSLPRRMSLPGYPFAEQSYWIDASPPIGPALPAASSDRAAMTLQSRVLVDLRERVSRHTSLPLERLDAEENLASFGLDSLGLAELARDLSKDLRVTVPPTVFFSHPTLQTLSARVLAAYEQPLRAHFSERDAEMSGERAVVRRPVPRQRDTREPLEAIAIIGMSGRFAGARTTDELWQLLIRGASAVTEIPPGRFDWRPLYDDGDPTNCRISSKWLAAVPGAAEFDPQFFSITPRDAEAMDPRQRILLQEAWNALEDAGFGAQHVRNETIGTFVGVEHGDYDVLGEGGIMATHDGILSARLSYFLDLHGPTLAINTACSSGLVAVHQACLSLRAGECTAAIAAGVGMLLTPLPYILMSQAGMLSTDAKCYPFDCRAQGLVPGEAVVAVVLKRLSQAVADGDPVHAVIIGSGINSDGKTNGITAPSASAQTALIRDVLDKARVSARDIEYVVAHGTGTRIGDPVEINALTEAFQPLTSERGFCAVTSTKPNVGHSFAASGIVNLVSLVKALQHATIPASLNCEQLSDYVDWQASPFFVNTRNRPWPDRGTPRRGATSAFGMSGTNAHIIVESRAPPAAAPRPQRPCYLFAFSAHWPEGVCEKARQLTDWLDRDEGGAQGEMPDCLEELSHTLLAGRHHFSQRIAILARDRSELREMLGLAAAQIAAPRILRGQVSRQFEPDPLRRQQGEGIVERFATLAAQPDECFSACQSLAELYCAGYVLPWERLFGEQSPRRIRLPTYPFRRQLHWVDRASTGGDAPVRAPSASAAPQSATLFFEERRVPEELRLAPGRDPGNVVCLLSDPAAQAAVRAAHRTLGMGGTLVFVSSVPDAMATDCGYVAARGDDEGLARALGSIRDRHGTIGSILYLWALDEEASEQNTLDIGRLLRWLAHDRGECERLLLVGPEAGVAGCHVDSWRALERSMALVLPQLRVRVISHAGTHESASDFGAWARRLFDELRAANTGGACYQGEQRHALRLTEIQPSSGNAALRRNGVYLITGGLGGLGLHFGRHLAERYGAKLVVTGRSVLDEAKQRRLQELQSAGAEVEYIQGDVCDATAMCTGLQRVRRRFGDINGVIHAAGVAGKTSIADKSMREFAAVLAPKTRGSLLLKELLSNDPLDFFCCFSSSSALLGDFGSCDYAVANRFEQAYASHRSRCGDRMLAINWPLWGDGGMGVEDREATDFYLRSSGQSALTREHGIRIFEQLLGHGAAQTLVLTGDPQRLRRFTASAPDDQPAAPPIAVDTLAERIAADLKELASAFLKLPRAEVDMEVTLAEFGLDSIGLTRFAKTLSAHFAVTLTPAVFFTHSTLARLGTHLATRHAQVLTDFYARSQADQRPTAAPDPVPPPVAQEPAQRAVAAVGQSGASGGASEPIAIIGMSGRFPQARSVQEMWAILAEGRDAVAEIPPERFDWRPYFGENAEDWNRIHSRSLGVLPGVAEFDPSFFDVTPREAERMDPRQRLLLQEAWRALEDAGCIARLNATKTGLFVGVEPGDYQLRVGVDGGLTANHDAVLAARLSYFLDLRGPVLAINTACSSGLVALHQACQSLRSGESDLAIAAAANLVLTPWIYLAMSRAGMLSPRGKCRAFDRDADGVVLGEAVVAVVLKKLSHAERDGDPVHAVIRGSGVNYDGRTQGITAPSGEAQIELVRGVTERSGIDPGRVSYVVAHGTGTRLGDPVEIEALREAFGSTRREASGCAVTSTKSNFGHTLAASGLVSVVGLVQAMRHQTVPPSLHCGQPSDYIDWSCSPLFINTQSRPWRSTDGMPRVGAVSSFGMSGTNAHVLIEEYSPAAGGPGPIPASFLVVLSAKSAEALQEQLAQLRKYVAETAFDAPALHAISHTLLAGRQHFSHRFAAVVSDRDSLATALESAIAGGESGTHAVRATIPADARLQSGLASYGRELIERLADARTSTARYREALEALADLYVGGHGVAWESVHAAHAPRRISLPTYPFARSEYWIDPGESLWKFALPLPAAPAPVASDTRAQSVPQRLLADLTAGLAHCVKLPIEQIDPAHNFARFGLDSVGITELAHEISRKLALRVMPAALFAHPTLHRLVRHLVETHADHLQSLYGAAAIPQMHDAAATGTKQQDSREQCEPIAICAVSGRFPQARDVQEFWRVLAEGREAVAATVPDRFGDAGTGARPRSWLGALDGIDQFDPLFFEVSPREAELMDPRQRLLLEEAWNALEASGVAARADGANVGVFVGVEHGEYEFMVGEGGAVTSNHDGVLAAHLSYFLNMRGPVLAINTACSSGLVALHQACLSLRAHECDAAVAAAVNLLMTKECMAAMARAGMLSATGKSYVFDRRADGLVPGEAAVALVLMRLSDAIRGGNPIHGLIRGSGINYDGRTNGITAPNGDAQADLIRDVYRRAALTARDIDYVVAHGTGTRLGDPMEIEALNRVFTADGVPAQRCAVTSPKTNFGHTFAASGLLSVVSVLQALRHELIPQSLNCEQLSEYVDWDSSPLFVNRSNRPWPAVVGKARRAAVSAFGMSGTNAHVVVEEWQAPEDELQDEAPAHLVMLSAKTAHALRARACALRDAVSARQEPLRLDALSYTLAVGRPHFRHRCAFVAADRDQLAKLLELVAAGTGCAEINAGVVDRNFMPVAERERDALQLAVKAAELGPNAAGTGQYVALLHKLADTYCEGYEPRWDRLWSTRQMRFTALPPYPFARQRCWLQPSPVEASKHAQTARSGQLHPLVHENTSTVARVRLSSSFNASEWFLRDHRVAQQAVLPGAAHLEMALAAARLGGEIPQGQQVVLRDVVWLRPVIAESDSIRLHVELSRTGPAGLAFEICADRDDQRIVYSSGRIGWSSLASPRIDLQELLQRCSPQARTGNECYEIFQRQGLAYGPAHRGVQAVHSGATRTGSPFVLARIELPQAAASDGFELHPSVIDSASQAVIGLATPAGHTVASECQLPFSVDAVEVLAATPRIAWALVVPANEGATSKFDIDVLDQDGRLCARLRGLTYRSVRARAKVVQLSSEATQAAGNAIVAPVWEAVRLPVQHGGASRQRLAVVMGTPAADGSAPGLPGDVSFVDISASDSIEQMERALRAVRPIEHLVWIPAALAAETAGDPILIEVRGSALMQGFRLVKALLNLGYGAQELHLTVCTVRAEQVNRYESIDPIHAGIHGLMSSAAKECVRWNVRVLDLADPHDLGEALSAEVPHDPAGNAWALREGAWHRRQLVACELPQGSAQSFRRGGLYVVIGGAGGLGETLSEYLITRYAANVVWIGRRELDEIIESKRKRLAALGRAPLYVRGDACNRADMERALGEIRDRFGQIHGLIHSAVTLLDSSLHRMDEARFAATLSGKLDASVTIAQVFRGCVGDFVLFFSSMQSFDRSAGQSNYAAGCAFTDGYARLLARLWPCKVKVVNWGYWGTVGCVAGPDYAQRMRLAGVESIRPGDAMALLEALLAGPLDQIGFWRGSAACSSLQPLRSGSRVSVVDGGIPALSQQLRQLAFGGAVPG